MTSRRAIQGYLLILCCGTAWLTWAGDPEWSYAEQADWGALEETGPAVLPPELYPYAECGIGQKQSPVPLGDTNASIRLNSIRTRYFPDSLSISNNGHTLKVDVSKGSLHVGREKYDLLQYHFHAPSEHTIAGQLFPLEIHFVHSSPDGKLAVLGVLAKEGKENAEFQKILDNAPFSGEAGAAQGVIIKIRDLLPKDRTHFFTYAGSLTTPPCTEGVDWYLLKEPLEVSQAQIQQFQSFYFGNARSLQSLNGRRVEIFPK
jgi:carbonic anhydrase